METEMGRWGEIQRDTEVYSQTPPQIYEARVLGTGSSTWVLTRWTPNDLSLHPQINASLNPHLRCFYL